MKVLVNSDITYFPDLVRRGLSRQLSALAEACRDLKFEIALPLTTMLEFQRQQDEYADRDKRDIVKATSLLDQLGVGHDPVDPDTLIATQSLSELFAAAGTAVDVIVPTYQDFLDAHQRACLHLSPQPAPAKGAPDEMRDLVIWSLAIRTAREQGGAMLISRDHIHTGELGREEALAVELVVVPSVDDALRFFRVETPDARLFQSMLQPVWMDLKGLGIDIPQEMSVLEVRKARFVQGHHGRPSAASALVRVALLGGDEDVLALRIENRGDRMQAVELLGRGADDPNLIERTVGIDRSEGSDAEYADRVARLRAQIEGQA